MCRVLADFLNPKGLHYRGGVYLKLFIDMLVKPFAKNTGGLDSSKAKVVTEYSIDGNRRIDIVIEDSVFFIPIEVKINAGEQEKQISDYAAFSRRKNGAASFVPVFFLTPDGRKPAEAASEDYVCLSFEEHIIPWLSKCLALEETGTAPPVREIMKQCIKAIQSFCKYNKGDEEMENAINDLITHSVDNYKAALLINEAFNSGALNFADKTKEIFKAQILKLVQTAIGGAEYKDTEGVENDPWYYISIPVKNKYELCINYDWKAFSLSVIGSKKQITVEEADRIKNIMSEKTGVSDENWGGEFIWVSTNAAYPGLENTDEDIYPYELYGIYSKNTQEAAFKIVSLAKALENI
jgi:hypothetical protein